MLARATAGANVTEHWLPIPGWEGLYEVSDAGKIRSVDRIVANGANTTRFIRGRILALTCRDGYMTATLKRQKRQQRIYVNRVMLLAFKPRADSSELLACHDNGNRADNRLANLRWDDHSGNAADTALHGTRLVGERHPNAKLNLAAVREIRQSSASAKNLADQFGVSASIIQHARSGRTWKENH